MVRLCIYPRLAETLSTRAAEQSRPAPPRGAHDKDGYAGKGGYTL